MRRGRPVLWIALTLLLVLQAPVRAQEPEGDRPPNLVIIFADDLG